MGRFSESEESDKKPKVDDKISSDEMNNNEKLNKFNATYIPTLPANDRKSGN